MAPRRRMMLQLTALVDLLFIVMFLQYIELQEVSNKRLAVAAVEQQSEEKRQAEDLKAIGGVVHQMIGIPPEALTGALRQAPEAEREKLLTRLDELKRQPPAKLVQHLRETAELKKY